MDIDSIPELSEVANQEEANEEISVEDENKTYIVQLHECRKIANIIMKVLKKNNDCFIGVSGEAGIGKSTAVTDIMFCLDKHFDLEKNMVYIPSEAAIKEKLFHLRKRSCFSVDEAMRAFYKREWMTKERRDINKLMSMCRKKNLAMFITLPNFWDLDPYIRNRIKIWIYVFMRGMAVIFIRDKSPFTDDPWWKKENQKRYTKATRGAIMIKDSTLLHSMKRMKNYAHAFPFPDLPSEMREKYERLSMEAFNKLEHEDEAPMKDKEKILSMQVDLAMSKLVEAGWKYNKIAAIFGTSASKVEDRLIKLKARPIDLRIKRGENILADKIKTPINVALDVPEDTKEKGISNLRELIENTKKERIVTID